jgi:spermidine/putrescine transport system substrate-binding protein
MKIIRISSLGMYILIISFWLVILGTLLFFSDMTFRSPKTPILTIFAWGDIFDPLYLKKFEQQAGVKVVISYYSTNEELLVKLKATRGKGYDIIVPSDYIVQQLIEEKLLKKIDKERLSFFKDLNPQLLNLAYDRENNYSIPFEWEVFGLGINRDYFKEIIPSWDLIFKEPAYRIAMVNDPLAAVLFAGNYLYGPFKYLNKEQKEAIRQLLINQKKWVEAYVDFRADYFLATYNCPVVVASSSYMIRSMKEFSFIDFIIPQEGTFITIENIALPRASTKDELVYRFLNFLYSPESIQHHFDKFGFFPVRLDVTNHVKENIRLQSLFNTVLTNFSDYLFFQKVLSEQSLRDMWISIKSA